jgi:hypothetical protein
LTTRKGDGAVSKNDSPRNALVETSDLEPGGSSLVGDGSDEPRVDSEGPYRRPLTPAEFRTALRQVEALGLTWTADNIPKVRAKASGTDDPLFTEEFTELMHRYPYLPRELGTVVNSAITGVNVPPGTGIGSAEDLKEKVKIARELVINPDYKSEFYFKHSTKVPYLTDIDWEVDLKVAERSVKRPPGVSYALLSLVLNHPSIGGGPREHQAITVAVNHESVNKLIGILRDVKEALKIGAAMTASLHDFELKNVGPKDGEKNAADK